VLGFEAALAVLLSPVRRVAQISDFVVRHFDFGVLF
jgi:hypothetical protein